LPSGGTDVPLPAVLLYLVLSRRLGGAFSFGGAVKG
jgi:multiple sugar transport system permease protein